MTLDILTPEGSIVSAESVSAVFLPGVLGEFEVLPHHAPIISALEQGHIRYRSETQGEQRIDIQSGFVTVSNDYIKACVEV